MYASISLLRNSDGSAIWYMATVATRSGKTALGFGASHFAALVDAIASIIKIK